MRGPASSAPAAAVLALGVLLTGCGVSRETRSALERDEPRPYGRVVVRSELTPKRATLGDRVTWKLTATLPQAVTPGTVLVEPARPTLDVAPRGEASIRPSREGVVWSRTYELRGFDLGPMELPWAALPVLVRSGASTSEDTLLFPRDSLAVDSLTRAISGTEEPDRGPIDPGLRPIDLAVAAAVAVLVALLVAAAVRRWRRGRAPVEAAAAPPEAPEAVFTRALEALRRDGPGLARDKFHDRLSDAVRRYVSGVTGVSAIDRTTRELESELRRVPGVRPDAASEVVRLLRRSDLVKFARRADAWDEARALIDDAERLRGTIVPPPPPDAAPPDRTAAGDSPPPLS